MKEYILQLWEKKTPTVYQWFDTAWVKAWSRADAVKKFKESHGRLMFLRDGRWRIRLVQEEVGV